MVRLRWVFVSLILVGTYQVWDGLAISRPIGVVVADEPRQEMLETTSAREKNGYRVIPLASFDIKARVLLTKTYWFDRESGLAPVDLVLGWGPMSDGKILKHFSFRQGGRFYYWWTKSLPIPREVIESHSANMHMIPANRSIEKDLKSLRPGNIVQIRGYLVEVNAIDGWRWKSSLIRTDTGAGACEVIWVESLEVS